MMLITLRDTDISVLGLDLTRKTALRMEVSSPRQEISSMS